MRAFLLAILLCVVSVASGGEKKRMFPNEHIYGLLMGKRVTLDALVWEHGKGLEGRVVLPCGQSVYVKRPPEHRKDPAPNLELPQGRLVRMVGILTYERIPPVPPGVQGYPNGFDYFSLALESFEVIGKAETEFPKLVPK